MRIIPLRYCRPPIPSWQRNKIESGLITLRSNEWINRFQFCGFDLGTVHPRNLFLIKISNSVSVYLVIIDIAELSFYWAIRSILNLCRLDLRVHIFCVSYFIPFRERNVFRIEVCYFENLINNWYSLMYNSKLNHK